MGVEYENLLVPLDPSFVAAPERIAALVERLRADRWVCTPAHPGWEQLWGRDAMPAPGAYNATGGWAEPFIEKPRGPRDRLEKRRAIPVPVDAGWIGALRDPRHENPQADELALELQVGADDWESSGLRYPFAYGDDEPGYHLFRILAARDFVVHGGLEPVEAECACGEDLTYSVDERAVAAPIEGVYYEDRIRSVCPRCQEPFDGIVAESSLAFRFALVIDCHKGWPRGNGTEDPRLRATFRGHPTRSVHGAFAPGIAPAFLKTVAETMGTEHESLPNFF